MWCVQFDNYAWCSTHECPSVRAVQYSQIVTNVKSILSVLLHAIADLCAQVCHAARKETAS